MSFTTTTMSSLTTRIAAAICLATWLAGSQAALADYVDVTQVGSTLHIIGDETADFVAIVGANDTPGKFAVYIHPDPWIYDGVEHINVDLAGGDNTLNMARIEIAGSVTVIAGNGYFSVLTKLYPIGGGSTFEQTLTLSCIDSLNSFR